MKKLKLLFVCILMSSNLLAQFDRKINFNAFVGGAQSIGPELDPDDQPYAFSNFSLGGQIGAGIQYNIEAFSFGFNFKYSRWFEWEDPIAGKKSTDTTFLRSIGVRGLGRESSRFQNYSFGLDAKYKLFKYNRLRPYLFGEVNYNLVSGLIPPREIFVNFGGGVGSIFRFNRKEINTTGAFGFLSGLGLEFDASDAFGLFLQGGYNIVYTSGKKELRQNMQFFNAQLGIRFSLFKSKTI